MLTQIVLFSLLRSQSGLQGQAWDIPAIETDDNTPEVFLVSAKERRDCARPGLVCLSPGGSATSEGVEVREDAPPITVLARGAQVAAVGALPKVALNQPWQVQLLADFKSRSADSPIMVAVMDAESPEALANHEALVMWDVNMKPGNSLGMRFLLSPEQGFQPSHSYVLRVVQGQGKSEELLAEGEFHLE
ncbi:MAG TPA: hypothetical protein VIM14_13790 [Polyangia bacterium]